MPHPVGRPTARRTRRTALFAAGALGAALLPLMNGIATAAPSSTLNPNVPSALAALPYFNASLPVEDRVKDLLGRMTLDEKIGQMTQAERGAVDAHQTQITTQMLGSLLSGGGSTPTVNTPASWVAMVDGYQSQALKTRLAIPLIYGIDAVHGHGNVQGATLFPHNIGMGATRDPALAAEEGRVTGAEVRATGIPWDFAPCLCVTRDERWGRSYESFGEDPALVQSMETVIDGLQGTRDKQLANSQHVLATAKHFAGDGDTDYGTGSGDYTIDQGVTQTTRADFARIDLAPFTTAIGQHHIGTVMPSYSSVDFTDESTGPVKMHGNKELLTDVLKGQMGFNGFVISDYNGIDQLPPTAFEDKVALGVNAGIDMFMQPFNAPTFEAALAQDVADNKVPVSRVDDAVTRILREKFKLGLFERPYTDKTNLKYIGNADHTRVARQAAAESQVLLKNSGSVLPLAKNAKVYVAGRNADDLGDQLGGWSVTWQGFSGNAGHATGTTILAGMRQDAPNAQITFSADASAPTTGSDVGVVVVGETPYSEGYGDVGGPEWAYDPTDNNVPREAKSLTLQPQDRATVDKVCAALPKCVVLIVSGRPQVVSDQLPEIDALVASWLPGSQGAGVADVLFGRRSFTGQLPVTWPASVAQVPINVGDASYAPAFPFGWGLRTDSARTRLSTEVTALRDRPKDADANAAVTYVKRADDASLWNADGSVKDAPAVALLMQRAADRLGMAKTDVTALRSAVASVVREMAQHAVVAGTSRTGAADLIARSDVLLLKGQVGNAVEMDVRAAGTLAVPVARAAQLSAL